MTCWGRLPKLHANRLHEVKQLEREHSGTLLVLGGGLGAMLCGFGRQRLHFRQDRRLQLIHFVPDRVTESLVGVEQERHFVQMLEQENGGGGLFAEVGAVFHSTENALHVEDRFQRLGLISRLNTLSLGLGSRQIALLLEFGLKTGRVTVRHVLDCLDGTSILLLFPTVFLATKSFQFFIPWKLAYAKRALDATENLTICPPYDNCK